MSYTVCGTCSLCGGRVTVPSVWLGIYPPTPTCQSCGATPRNAHGPVIDMESATRHTVTTTGTGTTKIMLWTAALAFAALLTAVPTLAQFIPIAGGGRGNNAPCIETTVNPHQLALVGTRLLIADYDGLQARACDIATGRMELVAQFGQRPLGIASDGTTTYVSLLGGGIVAVDGTTQRPLTAPGITQAYHLAVGDGALWVADQGAGQNDKSGVWRIPLPCPGGVCAPVRVLGPEWVRNPQGVAYRDGALYVSDTTGARVLRRSSSGAVSLIAGNGARGSAGDGGPAAAAQLNFPAGLAVDADGSVYIADSVNNRIRRVRPDGVIVTVVGTGALNAQKRRPMNDDPLTFPVTSPSGVAAGGGWAYYGSAFDGAINAVGVQVVPVTATPTSAPPTATRTLPPTATRTATATVTRTPTPAPTCVPECVAG